LHSQELAHIHDVEGYRTPESDFGERGERADLRGD
jgi:hypothetical protein